MSVLGLRLGFVVEEALLYLVLFLEPGPQRRSYSCEKLSVLGVCVLLPGRDILRRA